MMNLDTKLREEGYIVPVKKVAEIVSSFFFIIKKLMLSGERYKEDTYPRRIEIPVLGNFIYNNARLLKIANSKMEKRRPRRGIGRDK